ncbi:MAG TPA: SHOCT domain-containing protein [Ktedonobacterales bacterium]|nr:SHOCT domain-containing protein [Ktedonobacterales bacterium]
MLKQLGELKASGVLTDEEFQAKKAELLKQI